eukprot:TRINITY_DN1134_c0_g1_i1.p1 TRINITY_DN1134_c0_g1~~TRINITY_DN1134_c0_g1_i1.p1  ORF type:complete len:300 (+),score=62.64 TRINITY_DN1134_c0_g1_i1:113-1012(+)
MQLAENPDWADVKPIPQDDGPRPACAIAYTDEFREAMDYFRAVMHAKEMSIRALDLTTHVISLNAANYTVWHFRRELLQSLDVDLNAELAFIAEVIEHNLKNYQVWHHRQAIVTMLNDASSELEFTEAMLAHDAKNYHAWTHRQWAMVTFDLFAQADRSGLGYVDRLLEEDLWNNSAWSHRHFVISRTTGWTDAVVTQELEYTLKAIRLSPNNESSWNYLRGIVKSHGSTLADHPAIDATVQELKPDASNHCLALWYDLCLCRHQLEEASKACQELMAVDPVRHKYWQYRLQQDCGGAQ